MAAKKTYSTNTLKRRQKNFLAVLIVFWLVAFLLTFEKVAEIVSDGLAKIGINVSAEMLRNTAVALTFGATGAILMQAAATFSLVPFVGVGLAVVGGAFLVAAAITSYNIFGKSDTKINEPLR